MIILSIFQCSACIERNRSQSVKRNRLNINYSFFILISTPGGVEASISTFSLPLLPLIFFMINLISKPLMWAENSSPTLRVMMSIVTISHFIFVVKTYISVCLSIKMIIFICSAKIRIA